MKKFISILALMLCLIMAFTGCGGSDSGSGSGSGSNEQVDENKVQLYVYSFARGFGSEYVYKLKTRYEALHANDTYTVDGKTYTGVQIMVNASDETSAVQNATMFKSQKDEVFFTEQAYYRVLANDGALLDLTDVVTGTNSYDNGKKIVDKLNSQQQNYLLKDGNYYGVPHYQADYGIIYDVDLFDANGFYFRKDYQVEAGFIADKYDEAQYGEYYSDDMFIDASHTEKTAGPDMEYGTEDDGLPTTYDEFFFLLEYISSKNCTPVSWSGTNYASYLNHFTHSLVTDYEGYDDMTINYTYDGTTKCVKANGSDFDFDSTEDIAITTSNAEKVRSQVGVYKALSFMSTLLNTERYHIEDTKAFGSFSHTDNQEEFLRSSYSTSKKDVAMIIDGVWWQREATTVFSDMVSESGEKASANSRNFALMSLPKATASMVDGVSTHNDVMNSFLMVRSNIAEGKKELAKDFVKFACTDESLAEFTTTTSCMKALKYELSSADQAKLTPFGKNMYNSYVGKETVYPYANSTIYINNISKFSHIYYNVNATTACVTYLRSNSVKDTFKLINSYYASSLNK